MKYRHRPFVRLVAALAAVLLLLVACTKDEEIGKGLKKSEGGADQCGAIGACPTTTEAAAVTTAAPTTAAPTTAKPAATTAPPTTRPPARAQVVTFTIWHDNSGHQPLVDPMSSTVYQGGEVEFVNNDTEMARGIEWDKAGAFPDSGDIAIGKSWRFTVPPNTPPGNYAFTDHTRPYVKGSLRVLTRPAGA